MCQYSHITPRALFLLSLVYITALWAQETICDPGLIQPLENPYGYRLRGDRCEGVYIREVAGTTSLRIVSFTEFYEDFDLESDSALSIEWEGTGDAIIQLRAYGLKRHIYYQMDTALPIGSSQYRWPSELLRILGLGKKYLGVVGSTDIRIDDEHQTVMLPLRIWKKTRAGASKKYRLAVLPGARLHEAYLSIAKVGDSGGLDYLEEFNEKPLEYGYYPAESPLIIPITGLRNSGTYLLEIAATLSDGGSVVAKRFFYHNNGI